MAVNDWSTNPAQNVSISGTNIGEGCPPGNINNALRQIMADVRVFYNNSTSGGTASYVTKSGGVFTGNPVYSGRGGYHHHNDPGMTSGRWFVQASGGTVPAMANGDFLVEY
jgi:hypothetical protein